MTICPRCERLIRRGEFVRASVIGEFSRTDDEGHYIQVWDEEWIEHVNCEADRWEEKVVKWVKRRLRKWFST